MSIVALVMIGVSALLWVLLVNPILTRALTRDLLLKLADSYADDATIIIGGVNTSDPPECVTAAKHAADEVLDADTGTSRDGVNMDDSELRHSLRRDAIAIAMARSNWLADPRHERLFRDAYPGRSVLYRTLVLAWWIGLVVSVGSLIWIAAKLL